MSDGTHESPDRSLFLVHFERGKELHHQRRFAEAEAELEEAYFLRPRDPSVLNVLGLVYYRQQKLDKAEEVYRKLLAQNPEEPTLSYNLGVIYLKLNRLEEAEHTLIKALELSGTNPRISFYLGTVYERQRRFQDAIFHYRHAGASALIKRIEDQMAAGAPAKRPKPRRDDTAEFKTSDVRAALSQPPPDLELPAKPVRAVSPAILAQEGPSAPDPGTTPPQPAPAREVRQSPVRTLPPAPTATQPTIPASETFRFLEPHVLQVDFAGKIFIKQGTIYSYSGDLTFWVKDRRPGTTPALVIITGRGRLILTERDREITLMHVDEEAIYVEPSHLLACEETLTPRYVRIDEPGGSLPEFVHLEGRGIVALSATSRPLALAITPDLPVSVPAPSVIMWSGALAASTVADREIYEVIQPGAGELSPLIRLVGRGRLLMEQARPA